MTLRSEMGCPDASGELWVAGAIAGVANTVVANPVEHIRIRKSASCPVSEGHSDRVGLQTQPVSPRPYSGPLDCAVKLYRANGIAGIFKGQVSTMWRDGVGYGWVSLVCLPC